MRRGEREIVAARLGKLILKLIFNCTDSTMSARTSGWGWTIDGVTCVEASVAFTRATYRERNDRFVESTSTSKSSLRNLFLHPLSERARLRKKVKAWKIFSRVFLLIFRLNGVSLTPHTEASLHRISLILKIFSRRNWILSRLVLRLRRKRCCVVVAIMFISRSHKFVCLLKRLRAVPALAEMYHSIGREKLQFFLFPRQFYSGRFLSSPKPKELTQKWQLIYHCPLRQGLQLRNSRWKRNKRAWISENERHTR